MSGNTSLSIKSIEVIKISLCRSRQLFLEGCEPVDMLSVEKRPFTGEVHISIKRSRQAGVRKW